MLWLIFWAVTLIVSLKYVLLVLRFDNNGEGGVLALLAYATRLTRANRRLQWLVAATAVFAASLFFGDAVITPAISVLSAVEGLSVAAFTYYVVGLVGYAAKGLRGAGLDVNPDLAMGISIPIVVVIVALGMHKIRKVVLRPRN